MAALRVAALCALAVVLVTSQAHPARAVPQPPRPCGSLDLSSPLTQHCFPADGSHHFVCCEGITSAMNDQSPHGNWNPLGDVIRQASDADNPSWCTCSEEICTEQLGGVVAWNMNGEGWKGFRPREQRIALPLG